jgi:outer membrane protein assembly factor BamB
LAIRTPGKSFLYAVDASSGKARWVTSVDGTFVTEPVTANGFVFFAVADPSTSGPISDRATLYAIDAANGQVKWKFGAAQEFSIHDLIVAANTIYFSTDQSLSALELATGRQVWTFNAAELEGPLLADDQRLYVVTGAGSRRSRVRALALTTGQEQWSQRVNARLATIHDGVAYLSGDRVYALDTITGKQVWSFKGTGRESVRLISGGRLFLTSHTLADLGMNVVDQGYLSALDARTGRLTPSR